MVSNTCKGISTVIGCILVHISLGTMYTIGNVNQYLVSYIYNTTGEVVSNSVTSWLFSAAFLGVAIVNMVGGILENLIHVKWTVLIGCIISTLSVFITYFVLQNYYLIIVFFGCLFGIGSGIAYSPCLAAGMKWFPKQAGLISGLIVMGFGCGALIFNNVQTLYLNPDNLSTVLDPTSGQRFYPESVTARVPSLFLILGSCYLVMQIIGVLMIFDPRSLQRLPTIANIEPNKNGEVITPKAETKDGINSKEAVKTCKFWEIYIFMYIAVLAVLFMSSYYKTIVLEVISDDQFLALIGSISSLCNGLSRPIWGSLYDKFGYKIIMSIICFVITCFLASLTFVTSLNPYVYFAWVCIIYFCIGGVFALLPSYTNKSFGALYMSTNYGWIFTSQALASLTFMFTSSFLINTLKYRGTTILFAVLMFIDFLLVMLGKNWTYLTDKTHLTAIHITGSPSESPVAIPTTERGSFAITASTPTPYRTPVLYSKQVSNATSNNNVISKIINNEMAVRSKIAEGTQNDEEDKKENEVTPKKEEEDIPTVVPKVEEQTEKQESEQEKSPKRSTTYTVIEENPEGGVSTTVVVSNNDDQVGDMNASRHGSFSNNKGNEDIIELSRSKSKSSSIISLSRLHTNDPMQASLLDPIDADDVILEADRITTETSKKGSIIDIFKNKSNTRN